MTLYGDCSRFQEPFSSYVGKVFRKEDISWLKKKLKYCSNAFERKQLEKQLQGVHKYGMA